MTIIDFVGDDKTGTTAELTDVEIAAEVTCELTSERWMANLAIRPPRTPIRCQLRAKLLPL
ncbi:hypothetical protein HPB48_015054 [Haemaphysalis longicornis]|uniref:Uncharacterized protein n=1 Tax=Haemaphysalis longicornis TaxID=44386 RepID=A0A9J6GS56_HAELO|nr:hypothetical protein HPB48_015054 [Haemaphysalis longicornis]